MVTVSPTRRYVPVDWAKLESSPLLDLPPPQQEQQPIAAPVATPATESVSTGIDPNELAQATYGKPIPISALGRARIGTAGIIFGPYIENGSATFAVSFGAPADPTGTRAIYEIAFDSKVAWEDASGFSGAGTPTTGFISESFTWRFKQGTLTQAVDALETAHFGSEAIAYRPQMCLFIENLPLAQFGNKLPFVAAVIGDTTGGADPDDGITLGEAFERMAYSPWAGFTTADFETSGVTDLIGGMIIAEDNSLMDLLQNHARLYRNLDIIRTDKLKVIDRGPVGVADITLGLDNILQGGPPIEFTIQAPEDVPRGLRVKTIDPDADFMFVPSLSQRPAAPVAVSASHGEDEIVLPIILDAATRQSLTAFAKYAEEKARNRVTFTAMAFGLEIEPGDRVRLQDIGEGIDDQTFRVIETTHGDNFVVEVIAEAVLDCNIYVPAESSWESHYETTVDSAIQPFADVDIGEESEDRLVVIVAGSGITNNRTITGVTIGGIPADLHVTIAGAGVAFHDPALAIASAVVPTGTSVTVNVTYSGLLEGSFIDVYILTGYQSATPTDTASASITGGGTPSATIDAPEGGTVIAGYVANGAGLSAVSWTGLSSEDTDEEAGDSSFEYWCSAAHQSSMAAEIGRTIAVAGPAVSRELLAAVAFQ